jgi:hypothetical protein
MWIKTMLPGTKTNCCKGGTEKSLLHFVTAWCTTNSDFRKEKKNVIIIAGDSRQAIKH